MKCPAIPFTAAEVRREAYLWRLAAAFQALMDEARNPCALKGGTALRFQAGLSRPSTDLDFEGDGRVSMRKTLVKAVARATPAAAYHIGRDLLWRGTVTMTLRDAEAGRIQIGVDYRKTGSRSGMPEKVPLDRCERVRGINIYRPSETREPEAADDRGKAATDRRRGTSTTPPGSWPSTPSCWGKPTLRSYGSGSRK